MIFEFMRTIHIVFAALLLTGMFGCKKIQERRIVGEWNVETLQRGGEVPKWIFYDDNTVAIINDLGFWAAVADTIYGEYGIKAKMQNYVYIDCNDDETMDGKYYIEKMSKTTMKLTRREYLSGEKGGAFLAREFYK